MNKTNSNSMVDNKNKIEILSVDLLKDQRSIVNDFKSLSYALGNYPIGWHYLLDWSWIFSQLRLNDLKGKVILDAGASTGLSQWYMAERGATVISVDRISRACLPLNFRIRYHVSGLRSRDLLTVRQIMNPFDKSVSIMEKFIALLRSGRYFLSHIPKDFAPGEVIVYNQDLADLVDILDNYVDFIVSVSSLEHNTPDGLEKVVDELNRVLKPGGKLIATLGAGKDKDWFHEPSQGWCYTAQTLQKRFKLPAIISSNYNEYDRLLDELKNCRELRDNVAFNYRLSKNNGLPGGKWDLKYQPVGVVKTKE
jgi:SAM-dependent methyltransferase